MLHASAGELTEGALFLACSSRDGCHVSGLHRATLSDIVAATVLWIAGRSHLGRFSARSDDGLGAPRPAVRFDATSLSPLATPAGIAWLAQTAQDVRSRRGVGGLAVWRRPCQRLLYLQGSPAP